MLLSAPSAARGLKDYQRAVWTQQHGAPTDTTTFAQSADGWLWIGSRDSLFRFDGTSFEPYTPLGYPEFAHLRVVEMHAADNGDLCVAYFPMGVAVLRRDGSYSLLPQPEDLRRTPPLAMVLDYDNSLWTIGHGIRRFAKRPVDSRRKWPGLVDRGAYSLLIDQDRRR